MFYKKCGDTYVVRLEIGEEILESITELCKEENIRAAEITGIGAAAKAVVGIYNVDEKQYYKTEIDGPLEIVSLLGNASRKDGEPYLHLHASFSGESCNCVGGHLNSAVIGVTAEIFLRVIDGEIERTVHPVTGLNVFDL
ncbi:MAG: DNA-binding protein [Clostridia bacterium]|jgi:predicted DNA-binding protein with PD1-like motif|nr:DNA-binding protein [Clostridia bacterium]MBQ4244349.1 DNA-binding protein [Clostridia bacterium]